MTLKASTEANTTQQSPALFLPSNDSWIDNEEMRREVLLALSTLRAITTNRDGQSSTVKNSEIYDLYCRELRRYHPYFLLKALEGWTATKHGRFWPMVAELMAEMREIAGPDPEPEYQPALPKPEPSPEEKARVEAGFTEALTAAKPEYVKLEDRERPPPRHLQGEQLAEARKAAINRLVEYGGQGAG